MEIRRIWRLQNTIHPVFWKPDRKRTDAALPCSLRQDSMNRVNQVNFANPSHRQTANIPFVEVFQCNLSSAALRTSLLLPDGTNYRLFLKVLYVFFLKFTDSLIVECQTKRTSPLCQAKRTLPLFAPCVYFFKWHFLSETVEEAEKFPNRPPTQIQIVFFSENRLENRPVRIYILS